MGLIKMFENFFQEKEEVNQDLRLQETNSYIREFLVCIDFTILQIDPLINYLEDKFENCEERNLQWNSYSFRKKECIFKNYITEKDISLFRINKWIK